MSIPNYRTSHFNCDGDNKMKSKVMIIVFSTICVGLSFIFLYYWMPIFTNKTIRSENVARYFNETSVESWSFGNPFLLDLP